MLVSHKQMVKPCWPQELVERLTMSVRKEQLWLWGGGGVGVGGRDNEV